MLPFGNAVVGCLQRELLRLDGRRSRADGQPLFRDLSLLSGWVSPKQGVFDVPQRIFMIQVSHRCARFRHTAWSPGGSIVCVVFDNLLLCRVVHRASGGAEWDSC